jgi:hypothetical protein
MNPAPPVMSTEVVTCGPFNRYRAQPLDVCAKSDREKISISVSICRRLGQMSGFSA